MSQFEYVSVAVALVFTLVVGRLLAGLSAALSARQPYLVHSGWLVQILLVCVAQWWVLWRTSAVEWTAFRFLWVLTVPSLQYVRVAVLVGSPDSGIDCREHFYSVRRIFFGIGLLGSVHAALSPWVLGVVPWLTPAPIHPGVSVIAAVSIVGLAATSPRIHGGLVVVANLLAAAMFGLPPLPENAP